METSEVLQKPPNYSMSDKIGTKEWSWRTQLKHVEIAKHYKKVLVDLKNLYCSNRPWLGREGYSMHECPQMALLESGGNQSQTTKIEDTFSIKYQNLKSWSIEHGTWPSRK